MSETTERPDPADNAHAVEQASRLRDQAAKGSLKFEAYLPPSLALWLLDQIERAGFSIRPKPPSSSWARPASWNRMPIYVARC
ncbi:MAG: hypothetical protein CBARDCOR_3617 [uncultured Caballeronia sp.]|nr:MAG: hypothetical protein CBARDCOR_3617 [uncultured Caballeronia sp.]